ncbi:RING-box protein 1 [Cichlidogyrus casuarinus]|uniref:RING-box protein 1 n=1 Tax=Cichlidogyrus casuarinus TaxID=1844966 RepID=A0ABD2PWH4_9PLAT
MNGMERFELKRWNLCASWSWDVMHDTCVICRNGMMSSCIHCQARSGSMDLLQDDSCPIAWGVCNHAYHMHCIRRWLESSPNPRCPLDNGPWEFTNVGN